MDSKIIIGEYGLKVELEDRTFTYKYSNPMLKAKLIQVGIKLPFNAWLKIMSNINNK